LEKNPVTHKTIDLSLEVLFNVRPHKHTLALKYRLHLLYKITLSHLFCVLIICFVALDERKTIIFAFLKHFANTPMRTQYKDKMIIFKSIYILIYKYL
jgi:hypothetical protein